MGLWQRMQSSSCVQIQVPLSTRVNFIIKEYPHLVDNPDFLKTKIARLKSRHGREKINEWNQLIASGDRHKFVENILQSDRMIN